MVDDKTSARRLLAGTLVEHNYYVNAVDDGTDAWITRLHYQVRVSPHIIELFAPAYSDGSLWPHTRQTLGLHCGELSSIRLRNEGF
jgi:hypothetical protein